MNLSIELSLIVIEFDLDFQSELYRNFLYKSFDDVAQSISTFYIIVIR